MFLYIGEKGGGKVRGGIKKWITEWEGEVAKRSSTVFFVPYSMCPMDDVSSQVWFFLDDFKYNPARQSKRTGLMCP